MFLLNVNDDDRNSYVTLLPKISVQSC